MSAASKFRKLPVVIEAMQFTGGPEVATSIIEWVLANGGTATWREALQERRVSSGELSQMADPEHLRIRTLEGVMRCYVSDWVIRGVKGEFYPCKPAIFAATYEQVTE